MKPNGKAAKVIFLIPSFLFIFCFSTSQNIKGYTPEQNTESTAEENLNPAEDSIDVIFKENPSPFFALLNESITPGEPCTVIFLPVIHDGKADIPDTAFNASLYNENGKRLARAVFFDWVLDESGHTIKSAVFSVPSTAAPGSASVKLEGNSGLSFELPLRITERKFTAEVIPLNPSNTSLRTVPDPQKTRESEQLWTILNRTGSVVYTQEPFTPPVERNTRRTSFFGDRRVYEYSNGNSDTAVHAGIDYGVPIGTEVAACADGKVVLARARIVTGNSVIIEHLPGLYSIYYHLDKILAAEGQLVKSGYIIGLSGSTGLATGPHLHWELRASGENTDPDILSSRAVLDKNAALTLLRQHQF